MVEEVSAGGVVVFGNAILLLKRFNGDWVLPKGRVEKNESAREAAIREVFEESGVRAEIIQYIGMVHYTYKNIKEDKIVYKTVHWYLMKANSMESVPQKKEGFIEATFIHKDKVKDLIKYNDERKIIKKVLRFVPS
ncbi:NUDIX hydrolase [Tepidimicrobium xylanilyticum]|uniref:NUDIX domain-containing protein n=1 Tax=Tepidimicrobium xylanilyticum TaxID=1123352 RepID=A0A1H2UUU7_9FIRM|nr:NUDIX hydrolase [Tepidimicrobium xylanilyticum]GMG96802.1 NUDIX hydrolase [Tepidimicrobium xylanilyticum]SDW59917.1 NUDIX domain-containing protein [Tepidimicrobium xylanilyticum]